jgi:L-alanine-DL-glutamate epimerase-like enolase superfamily enzyme
LISDKAKGAGVPCRLCAVLPSKPVAALAQAKRLFSAGVSTFKIKVGPSRVTEDQKATLSSLREALGSRVALRVDANGSFVQSEVDAVMHQLRRYSPEFVEEPLMTPAPKQVGGWACPTALDESLARLDDPSRAELIEAGCRVLVLKPTVLGGLARCLMLAHHARELGAEIVVSHTLEGRVGWTACAQLALALSSPLAAGLWPMSHQSRVGDDRIEGGWLLPTAAVGLGTPLAL